MRSANFYKQYTSYKTRAFHIAMVQADRGIRQEVLKGQKELEAAQRCLDREKQKNSDLQKELQAGIDHRRRLEQILINNKRRSRCNKFLE